MLSDVAAEGYSVFEAWVDSVQIFDTLQLAFRVLPGVMMDFESDDEPESHEVEKHKANAKARGSLFSKRGSTASSTARVTESGKTPNPAGEVSLRSTAD